ncbi:hypothetical protein AY599_26215 [Leptolyngbya valderiana BDU 20041]|nr:hypothetical protein AY599_26215 [Leptolyngbya valderiana BDU 20041]
MVAFVRLGSFLLKGGILGLGLAASSMTWAAPIGSLQIDGLVSIEAPGSGSPVPIRDTEYTLFSDDRIITRSGSALLALDGGGSIGLAPASAATVSVDERSGAVTVSLDQGTLLYSLPSMAGQFRVLVDDFELQTSPGEGQALSVDAQMETLAGVVRRLDNGQIDVAVESGMLSILTGKGSRYNVAAGDRLGLMANLHDAEPLLTQVAPTAQEELIRIESPEQVETNENFRIRWDGISNATESFIAIAERGAEPEEFQRIVNTDEGPILLLEAPEDEGDYEIRFIDGDTGFVTSFVYLKVVDDELLGAWWMRERFGALELAGGILAGGVIGYWIKECDPMSVSP